MVVRHVHKAVHHLRGRPHRDREVFAKTIAVIVIAFLALVWLWWFIGSVSKIPYPNGQTSAVDTTQTAATEVHTAAVTPFASTSSTDTAAVLLQQLQGN